MVPHRFPLRRAHARIVAWMWGAFAVVVFLAVGAAGGGEPVGRRWMAAVGSITGPMTGAIARGGQSCCVEFGLSVAAVAGPLLVLCVGCQWMPWLAARPRAQLAVWVLGWLQWFAAGILSFGHALS